MRLRVRHSTRYTYTEPLTHSVQSLHMWPASGPFQTMEQWSLTSLASLHGRTDGLGNRVYHGSFTHAPGQPPVLSLEILATGLVETHGVARWCDAPGAPPPSLFLRSTAMVEPHPRMAQWAREWLNEGHHQKPLTCTVEAALTVARAVQTKVRYRSGSTGVETTALEAFDGGHGVCQDQAQVMVAVCRSLGWPARYVSGYFYATDEPDLASHAWAEVCLDADRSEWLAVDVTHACPVDERHIRLAAGTDYSTCSLIKGVRHGGGTESMAVDIKIHEENRP